MDSAMISPFSFFMTAPVAAGPGLLRDPPSVYKNNFIGFILRKNFRQAIYLIFLFFCCINFRLVWLICFL